ncbi:MAG: AI-2E family transporter [Planctomycetota bacterium]|nr:AI-2E family transporter [Planctomycetota bacterium]
MSKAAPANDDQDDGGAAAGGRKPRVRILLTFLAVFVLLLAVFREVLFPFLMAIYIAYLIEPIVARVVKSRLLGFKWTRGPTIVTLYVLILGGIFLLGWWGVVTLAKQVRSTADAVESAVAEQGYRATFELIELPPPPEDSEPAPDDAEGQVERGVLVPKDTLLVITTVEPDARTRKPIVTQTEFATLYPIRVTPSERSVSVLLRRNEGERALIQRGPATEGVVGGARLKDIMGLRYADADEKISLEDAGRLTIRTTDGATGFEFFMEREIISPIVENLAGAGYHVEPNLLRDYIAIQGAVVREGLPERIGKTALTIAGSLVFSVYEFFLILMLTAFIVMDRKTIAAFFRSLPPSDHRPAYDRFVRYIDDGLAGVIRGQLVICGVNGVLTYIGLLLLGVPYATMLSVIAAILSLIPVFGTIVSSLPIVLIAATKGLDIGLYALGWIVFIHMLEANVFNPMIMGSHARMHPVIIIFSLLAGEHAFGIWGALLAVPTMSLLQSSFRFYLHEIEGMPKDDDGGSHGGWMGALWRKIKARLGGKPAAEGETA